MPTSLFAELFAALDMVVMERQGPGVFALVGPAPDWFKHYHPDVTLGQGNLHPGDWFPFLDNFLIDAETFWHTQSSGQTKSGPWGERDRFGHEHFLEASAVCLGERKILLLAFPKMEYEEKLSIIQRARENNLIYGRFNKEQQHKDVLLHCIVHDLSGPLTSIILGLSLLETEALSPTGRSTVATCLMQATKQQGLIGQILDIFAAEVGGLGKPVQDPALAPDLVLAVQNVSTALQALCLRNQLALQLDYPREPSHDWHVRGETSRLERVLYNLLDNAIRHSPSQSVVTLSLVPEATSIVLTVDDEGAGVPPELVETIFEKFSQAKARTGKVGLGLYFCRITVEGWGGSLGYAPRPSGGARFWCRLPRYTAHGG
ncbi:MAG: sensor histidine kinase [Candidatus Tectimicrobiota bacterium]